MPKKIKFNEVWEYKVIPILDWLKREQKKLKIKHAGAIDKAYKSHLAKELMGITTRLVILQENIKGKKRFRQG